MNGYVVVAHKDEGWTSHDLVQRLRCVLGVQEIGHAGSLDPFATGVLVCGVGRGTKVLSYLMELPKEYAGLLRLGKTTDTGDPTGRVLVERRIEPVGLEEARSVARGFVGVREQVPPMVSALKHQGRRLYELARKGIEIERKPRRIEIHDFEILEVAEEAVAFRVRCSKGTYIRTLAQEFGQALGPGASLERLCRTAVGPFRDVQAVRVSGDTAAVAEEVRQRAIPLAEALSHLPALQLHSDWVRKIRQGARPPWRAIQAPSRPECSSEGSRFRLLGPEGDLIAIASLDAVPGPVERSWSESWELLLDRVL